MHKPKDKIKKHVWCDAHAKILKKYHRSIAYEADIISSPPDASWGDMWWFIWNQMGEDLT